jgi:DNA-binding SARP family transcriptional activator
VDIRLLGPLQVLDSTGRLIEIHGDRPSAVLVRLALSVPNFVSFDEIADALWEAEEIAAPEAALQVTVSRLRKALGESVISTMPGGYRLDLPATNCDVERFRRHLRQGHQLLTLGKAGPASEAFRQALAQWRGTPLAQLRKFEFIERAARVLEEERLVAVESLMDAELQAGNHDLVVGELAGLVEVFPLRERLWEHLMTAYYRGKRQAEALRAFAKMRQILGEELGVDPSPALVELEERILLHDPGLETHADIEEAEWLDEPEMMIFAAGELIFEEGSPADSVYWVEDGLVSVHRTADDGTEVTLTELGPGRYFGELAPLLGTARTATVRAITPTTLSVHTAESFRRRLGVERAVEQPAPTLVGEVRDLIRRGEYLRAYDLASGGAQRRQASPELRYLSVLALARAGATEQAMRRYQSLDLARLNVGSESPRLSEDIAALSARLDKDMALTDLPRRSEWATRSAQKYEAAFERHRSAYLAVNAATMWLMAGELRRSSAIAADALNVLSSSESDSHEDLYWHAASEAEASLILGNLDRSREALARAAQLSQGNQAARATTLRQLRNVCGMLNVDEMILTPIRNPIIVHFCGHRIGTSNEPGRFPPAEEGRVAEEIAKALEGLETGVGFGSLAAGADILAAEALLERGAELQIYLPFDRDEFVRNSVEPAGDQWVRRFDRCLDAAAGVTTSFTGEHMDDPVLFDFCSRMAMGDAVIRAGYLESDVHQIAVWDGLGTSEVAGTAVDVARWREGGRASTVIQVNGEPPKSEGSIPAVRRIRAVVFGDFAGFSRLSDAQMRQFQWVVMKPLAAEVNRFRPGFLCGNTWGDALYLVFDDVHSAAECALSLQTLIGEIDLEQAGLAGLRGMRIAAHAGPVFEGTDAVTGDLTFFGLGVTQAARIEPRTPEGEVYVTRAFAALTSLTVGHSFQCSYVGTLPVAKGYGYFPLFSLRRRSGLASGVA